MARKNKGQSITRAIKRGNVKGVINTLYHSVDFLRRTSTSKKHTVLVERVKMDEKLLRQGN